LKAGWIMSVRAYRVVKIVTGGAAFNLWHDTEVCELLGDDLSSSLNINGGGLVELGETVINRALAEATEDHSKEILGEMLEDAKLNNGYVTYYCY